MLALDNFFVFYLDTDIIICTKKLSRSGVVNLRHAKIKIIKNYAIYKMLVIRNSKKPIIISLCKMYNVTITILLLYLYVIFTTSML